MEQANSEQKSIGEILDTLSRIDPMRFTTNLDHYYKVSLENRRHYKESKKHSGKRSQKKHKFVFFFDR